MNSNDNHLPGIFRRIFSIWYRHYRVYTSNFISNAFPPFFEPLIFLAGLGLGIGTFMPSQSNFNYLLFLASGLVVTSAMYTSSFECTYGTFVRLEFDKVYDGMLGAPLSPANLMIGEILFAATKGLFFSFAVLVVVWIAGIITTPLSILAIFVGLLTGVMFGAFGLFVTSFVKSINHFNFFFTGLLSPMFFFSGVVFPLDKLPVYLQGIAEIIPLTHLVRLARVFCNPEPLTMTSLYDFGYCIVFVLLFGWIGIRRLTVRMTQ